LLLGGTGSGKTSFLNLLLNLDKWNVDEVTNENIHEIIKSMKTIDKDKHIEVTNEMPSQTKEAISYERNFTVNKKEICLTIIDTPGFDDTEGLKADKENAKKITKKLGEIDALDVVFIINNGIKCRTGYGGRKIISELR